MLAGSDGLETNKGNLHTGKCTDSIPRRVGHVKSVRESTHENQDQGVKWDHIRDERISTCKCSTQYKISWCKPVQSIPQAATM